MRNLLILVLAGLLGLFAAASIGYAAYVVSRDTVGTPVTKVKLSRDEVAPVRTGPTARTRTRPNPTPTPTTTATPPPSPRTTTAESDDDDGDSSGRGRGRGRGGNSGKGGDDDD